MFYVAGKVVMIACIGPEGEGNTWVGQALRSARSGTRVCIGDRHFFHKTGANSGTFVGTGGRFKGGGVYFC